MNMTPVDILLIEDNPDDQELAKRALEKNNLTNSIIILEDGEKALNFLLGKGEFSDRNIKDRPKVILLDLNLPKISGLEVLKEIKSNDVLRHIPVVVLTSSTEDKDLIDSYNLGVNSYIEKPVEFDKFTDCILSLGLYWLVVNKTLY